MTAALPPLAAQALRRLIREHGAEAVADALRTVDRPTAGEPPEPGSVWQHRNGNVYTVLMITNAPNEDRYPMTIVYQGFGNGRLWSRRADDWSRSFHPYRPAS